MSPELNTTLRPFCSYPDSACPRGSVCLRSSPDGSRRHTLRSTFFRATPIHIMTNIRIPAHALVLIADGTKARLLRNTGTALHVNFVTEQQLQQENPPTRDQGTDKPGRFLGGDRVSRSAVEQTDWHRLAEERFAARVADLLYRLAHAGTFNTLIVIAPPKVLGNLRVGFHSEVATRVLAEVAKDLTSVPTHELPKRLSSTLRGVIEPRH